MYKKMLALITGVSKILFASIEEGQFVSGWLLSPLTAGFLDQKAESDLVSVGD